MNKEQLKNRLVEIQENIIKELEEKIGVTHSMVDIDEESTHDPEDFSHQYESGELETLIRTQLNKAKVDLSALNEMDFSTTDTVRAGAFVQTEKFNFFVGFPTVPFDMDGLHIVGVSKASPIYPFMIGKKTGDSFEFSGKKYVIKSIA